jgi:hypothetical protein
MLVGRRPYGDDATADHAPDRSQDVALSRRAGSAELERIVRRAITRDPVNRYPDIVTLQSELERLPIERPGRLRLPLVAGTPAYGLAALAPLVLLIFLGTRIIGALGGANQLATPSAMATAAPTATPSTTPALVLPVLDITATPVPPPQPTPPPATSTPMPTATLFSSTTPRP